MTTPSPALPIQSSLVAAFENKSDAENLHQFLTGRGVKTTFADLTQQQPENAIPAEFAKYQVLAAGGDEQAAEQAAHHTEEGLRLLQSAVHCPECGSFRIMYPNIPRNFLVSALMRVAVRMHVLDGLYVCLSCQHEWPPRRPEKS
jgi:hypothetical protein